MMRSRREVVRNQKLALISILFVAITLIIVFCISGSIKAQAASAEPTYKYYTSIEIHSGDTLWSIADDYITDDYEDMNAYITEICSINHISEDEIHSGQYITIPYYSHEFFE